MSASNSLRSPSRATSLGRGAPERLGGQLRRARRRQLLLTVIAVPLVMAFVAIFVSVTSVSSGSDELGVVLGAGIAFFSAAWLSRRCR